MIRRVPTESSSPPDPRFALLLGEGWTKFRVGKRYCHPLTITDANSRFLLRCEPLESEDIVSARAVFESTFREYGLPLRLRSDNGTPFASTAIGGLSTLSVWWVKLGILPERTEPGHPEQNGRHERMHRTLKADSKRKNSCHGPVSIENKTNGPAVAMPAAFSDRSAFSAAYERRLAEIRAVPDEALIAMNLDVHASVATVLGALPEIRALRKEMEAPSRR